MRYYCTLIFFLCIFTITHAQTVMIDEIPRDTSFTLHSAHTKALKQYPHIKKALPNLSESVQAIEHLVYSNPTESRELHLNIYRPKDNNKYPALLMVHGGGWSSGDLTLQIPMAQQIAAKGYVTIPVEYRLSPEAIYPAALFDLKTAIRWIRANADTYGIDTCRIAISGCSAGGHLATLTGITNGQTAYENPKEYRQYSSKVHAIINIDGISDFSGDELEASRISLSKNKIPASVKWLGSTYEEDKEVWEAASPIHHVTVQSPPVCFINSSIPRFHVGRDEIIEKLSTFKIYTEVHTLEDTPHPFWLFHPWFNTTVSHMVNFLDHTFKNKTNDF
ncbi:MAG: alpha/beta hydrolase [Prevotella sp.]|nr:alpha/beta hydrolase [Prevotella sp.]